MVLAGSYVTEAEAEAYFEDDPRAVDLLESDSFAWYLKRATKIIDGLPLKGTKYRTDGTQERKFPRQYQTGYDMDEATGAAIVPQIVKDAVCEEALSRFLFDSDSDRVERKDMINDGVKDYSLGSDYSETFEVPASDLHYGLKGELSWLWLSPHIAKTVSII